MGVVMKGGTSGCREDYLPPVPSSGERQPLLDTSTDGVVPSTVYLQSVHYQHPDTEDSRTPDFMPTGGTVSRRMGGGFLAPPSTTDVAQQDINEQYSAALDSPPRGTIGADNGIFTGAPNYGTAGGPATAGRAPDPGANVDPGPGRNEQPDRSARVIRQAPIPPGGGRRG